MDLEAIETNSQKLRWIDIALTAVEKGRSYQRKKTPLRPKIEWGRRLERERKVVWGGEKSKTIERDWRK